MQLYSSISTIRIFHFEQVLASMFQSYEKPPFAAVAPSPSNHYFRRSVRYTSAFYEDNTLPFCAYVLSHRLSPDNLF